MTDMTDRVVMVTGATNGIGEVTAHEIARMGATVIVVGRNASKTERVAAEIKEGTGNPNAQAMIADLSLMTDVRKLAADFQAGYDRLDVLVNNAGALFTDRALTSEGLERTFALNHLNYFLLTNLLLPQLKAAGTPERKARVVNVSSGAHNAGRMDFDNLNGEKRYSPMTAYGTSKLQNILFTYELARRLEDEDAPVTATCLHPGVVSTGFGKNNDGISGLFAKGFMALIKPFAISPKKGAETQIYLATSPEVEGVNGKYYDKKKPKQTSQASYSRADQEQLWAVSERLTSLQETVAV